MPTLVDDDDTDPGQVKVTGFPIQEADGIIGSIWARGRPMLRLFRCRRVAFAALPRRGFSAGRGFL